jgi:uncharacterized protein with HEPN domain
MRDKVVHHYFRLDLEIVWNTATGDIPRPLGDVQKIYDKLNEDE